MKIVLCNGVFDGLHLGHVIHLEQARAMGDRLVVSVTKDDAVNKGHGRPVFNHDQRAAMLRALRCVSEVIVVESLMEALDKVRPQTVVKGPDYALLGLEPEHHAVCVRRGIEIRFTEGEKYSSRAIFK